MQRAGHAAPPGLRPLAESPTISVAAMMLRGGCGNANGDATRGRASVNRRRPVIGKLDRMEHRQIGFGT